jgi:hypothetical protein
MREGFLLQGSLAVLATLLVAISQSGISYGDEGFHLLAAQVISAGKAPYRDFFYQHPPLYPYVLAGWMGIVGQSWRSAHLLSSLLIAATALLMANYLYRGLRLEGWALGTAILGAVLVTLTPTVLIHGTGAQPYAAGLFCSVASFALAIRADDGRSLAAFGCGCCASSAVACSLLTALCVPTLGLWLAWRAADRWRTAAWFFAGALVPLLPFMWLCAQAPRQVWFDLIEFHLFHRQLPDIWTTRSALAWDLQVLTSPFGSAQGMLLALLAVIGALFRVRWIKLGERRSAELHLCLLLALAMAAPALIAHPTFEQYFVFMIPFVVVLAVVGACAIGTRALGLTRGTPVALFLGVVFAFGSAKLVCRALFLTQPSEHYWPRVENVAKRLRHVAAASGDGSVFAEDVLWFAAGLTPPAGLESWVGSSLSLPEDVASQLRVVSKAQIAAWLEAGRFSTVVMGTDDPRVSAVSCLYAKSERVHGYYLFWDAVATQ